MTTLKQQKFVAEYVLSGNGAQSATNAGYSPSSAHVTASRLLRNANVASAIEAERDRMRERSDLRAQDVIHGLRKIAEDESAKNSDRIRAYELLGKHFRLFAEVYEATVTHDVTSLRSYSENDLMRMLELAKQQPAIEGEVTVLGD